MWKTKVYLVLLKLYTRTVAFTTSCLFEMYHYWTDHTTLRPAPRNPLLLKSATQLAQQIRNKQITSVEVVSAFIERIKQVNQQLNAVVQNRFSEALEDAQRIDKLIGCSSVDACSQPFLGVPFTTKESCDVAGFYSTSGSQALVGNLVGKDASYVRLMKEAGAICVGVTNIPEYCMWWECSNTVYGTTNNPYDLRRSPGGSTGGEGSLMAASGTAISLGTDIGGSVRVPAFYNGLFGHKTSPGHTDVAGINPHCPTELIPLLSPGPLCRFACDLRPLVKVLARDSPKGLCLEKKIKFSSLKIYYMLNDCDSAYTVPVDKEVAAQIPKVCRHFEEVHGTQCKQVNIEQFRDSFEMFLIIMKYSGDKNTFPSFAKIAFGTEDINMYWELWKSTLGQGSHKVPVPMVCLVERAFCTPRGHPNHQVLLDAFEAFKKQMHSLLDDDAVFLYPPQPSAAPYHGQTLFRGGNSSYSSIFNALQLPVTACPTGLSTRGLPLGVQVAANTDQDWLSIQVAEEIEAAFGGWKCPTKL